MSAVKIAKNGDTILLDSGTYSNVNIKSINIDGNVTIASKNPDSRALLTDISISGSSGLTVKAIDFQPVDASRMYTVGAYGSHDITFDDIKVSGPAGDAGYKVSPFMIRDSSGVTVSGSEFTHSWHGITLLNTSNVTIADNYLHDIRTDGVRGGGNSQLTISENYFTDFHPQSGDHPDAIQLWTTNTTVAAKDITITGNAIYRGTGDAIQGIFLGEEKGNLPYSNVLIADNLVIGGMYNGIALGNSTESAITDNVVVPLPGMASWIGAISTPDLKMTGNTAATYMLNRVKIFPADNNLLDGAATDGGAAAFNTWFKAQVAGGGNVSDLPDAVSDLGAGFVSVTTSDLAITKITTDMTPTKVTLAPTIGTSGADMLSAGKLGNVILDAGAGNDTLSGATVGTNKLLGGLGDDTYRVYSSGDQVVEKAGEGNDSVYAYTSYTLTDNVETLRLVGNGLTGTGNSLDNRIVGTGGADILSGGGGKDLIQGGAGNDKIYGDAGDDDLRGEAGDDFLFGGDGNDVFSGGAGNDTIDGGAGNDILDGNAGADILRGGLGADTFLFRPGDIAPGVVDCITDFSRAQGDKISLGLIDAIAGSAKNDAFNFIGTDAFSRHAGELRYSVSDGHAVVSGDMNGDGVADFTISLLNVSNLAATDFVL